MSVKLDLRDESRKPRSDKKIRVNASLDKDTHNKLKKLAISCDKTKTMMLTEIARMAVNHPDIIDFFQRQYNKDEQYRVVPIKKNGKVYY